MYGSQKTILDPFQAFIKEEKRRWTKECAQVGLLPEHYGFQFRDYMNRLKNGRLLSVVAVEKDSKTGKLLVKCAYTDSFGARSQHYCFHPEYIMKQLEMKNKSKSKYIVFY